MVTTITKTTMATSIIKTTKVPKRDTTMKSTETTIHDDAFAHWDHDDDNTAMTDATAASMATSSTTATTTTTLPEERLLLLLLPLLLLLSYWY